jgi:hypothetical protein
MKYEELPENMRKQIDELRHYAQTIQSDVLDALESAESPEEFRSRVDSSMDEIIGEAQRVREVLGTGKGSVVDGKKLNRLSTARTVPPRLTTSR